MKAFTETRFTGTPEEIRAAWLENRRTGIGGSDAAAILGMSSYSSPLSLWLEKTGRTTPEDISDKESVYWGNVLEDVIADEFKKRHPELTVRRKNASLRSVAYPFMLASLDREVIDEHGRRGILEIKTAGARRAKDWENGIPDYYLPQPSHYLAVTGYEFFWVVVLIGGQEYREYYMERDEDDIAALISAESKFWDMVVNGIMPEPSAIDDMAQAYPEQSDDIVEMLDMDIPQIEQLFEVNAAMKTLEEKRKLLGNEIKAAIGEHRGIQTGKFRVIWSRSETTRFDSKSFQNDHPDIYSSYLKPSVRDGGLRTSERNS